MVLKPGILWLALPDRMSPLHPLPRPSSIRAGPSAVLFVCPAHPEADARAHTETEAGADLALSAWSPIFEGSTTTTAGPQVSSQDPAQGPGPGEEQGGLYFFFFCLF